MKEIEGYMCAVEWEHELGQAAGGTSVYASLKDLIKERPCVETCGAVKVKVTLEEWVIEQDLGRDR